MVFFTCNYCGESIKKPSVVKHYATRCRGKENFLTCMDCQQDFKGNEFNEHTKCISEAERYSSKDYVPKASSNKGQKKQDTWIETVRSLSNEHNMEPKMKKVFERLVSFENIPRKKAKFENFVSNSFKIPMSLAIKVWDVLEKELQKLKNAKANNVIDKAEENVVGEKVTEMESNENKNVNNENKLKRKNQSAENDCENTSISEPKKKKVKNIEECLNGTKDEKNKPAENGIKSKKSKKHVNGVEHEKNIPVENGVKTKKGKKDLNGTKDEVKMPVENGSSIKSPKNVNIVKDVNDLNENKVENINQKTEKEYFDWLVFIAKYAVEGMSADTLKKKVFKQYLKYNSETPINKKEKIFNKKIKKCGLVIENNIIKINS